jgi:hypothetical protein
MASLPSVKVFAGRSGVNGESAFIFFLHLAAMISNACSRRLAGSASGKYSPAQSTPQRQITPAFRPKPVTPAVFAVQTKQKTPLQIKVDCQYTSQ